jgi:hypothetical protein
MQVFWNDNDGASTAANQPLAISDARRQRGFVGKKDLTPLNVIAKLS